MKIERIEKNVHRFNYLESEIILVGTAHVSRASADLVEKIVEQESPKIIAVELDEKRLEVIKNKNHFENLDIIQILKKKQTFFFIGHLLLSSFQKKISDQTGVSPGEEFRRSIQLVEKKKLELALIDRNIGVTLKKAWRSMGLWGKIKMIFSVFSSEKQEIVNEEIIENLKNEDELSSLIEEMGKQLPVFKEVLIDERDIFIAGNLQNLAKKNPQAKIVAVVGAGHVPGILKKMKEKITEKQLDYCNAIPAASLLSKLAPWIIPILVIGSIIYGFYVGKGEQSTEAIIYWVLANGLLSALGCLIALAHPLTILSGFIAAPFTSLNPIIGAGFVTAFVQAILVKPRVIDFVNIQENASKMSKWWNNRLTKILLVFVLSGLGSAIGTWIAIPMIARVFPTL